MAKLGRTIDRIITGATIVDGSASPQFAAAVGNMGMGRGCRCSTE
jgi:hypothetical protein